MKINFNDKYNTIAVYVVLTACAIILFYLGILKLEFVFEKVAVIVGICKPFIFGFALAYILDFLLRFVEEKIYSLKYINKIKLLSPKIQRGVSLFITYLLALFLIFLFLYFVLPQLIDSMVGLINDIPTYINDTTKFIDDILINLNINSEYLAMFNDNIKNFIDYIIKVLTELLPVIGNMVTKMASGIWNIVLGLIVSIYMLIDKERFIALCRKVVYAILPKNAANKVTEIIRRSNYTFGKFLSGKILDSLIIGIMTFIILYVCKMPYALLVSVIVGITNIIPFFGPFIGAVPSFIIILFVDPVKALWFLLIVFVIQQIDGNIIGPKILGDSIGISAFWILFAILVAGKFLGIVGMVIGVPLFAVVYSIIKEIVEERLRKKGLKVQTEDYIKK
ncbi:MAG: AI-2E family transporter [Clostridiales bacterium]|nr:AI-2E family transporter [Clostridiales bacterium]MDY2730231.1 AI-2E family transporter [Clostridium sp.]